MQDFLDVGAVEVIVWAESEGGEAEHVPEVRAEVDQVVVVEAGVDVVGGHDDFIPDLAVFGNLGGRGEGAGRGVGDGLVEEGVVAALVGFGVDVGEEGGV